MVKCTMQVGGHGGGSAGRRKGLFLAALAAALLAGCVAGPDEVVEVGALSYQGTQPQVDVPATGSVGEPLAVHVVTEGGGCVSFDSTEVDPTADGADVTPYDRRQTGTSCTDILLVFKHEAAITFDTPGDKTIRVHVRKSEGAPPSELSFQLAIQ